MLAADLSAPVAGGRGSEAGVALDGITEISISKVRPMDLVDQPRSNALEEIRCFGGAWHRLGLGSPLVRARSPCSGQTSMAFLAAFFDAQAFASRT